MALLQAKSIQMAILLLSTSSLESQNSQVLKMGNQDANEDQKDYLRQPYYTPKLPFCLQGSSTPLDTPSDS